LISWIILSMQHPYIHPYAYSICSYWLLLLLLPLLFYYCCYCFTTITDVPPSTIHDSPIHMWVFPSSLVFPQFCPSHCLKPSEGARTGGFPLVDRSMLMCGAASCGAVSRGAGRKGPRGTGRDRVWLYMRAWFCLSRAKLAFPFQSAFFPSLSVTVLSLFTKLVSNLEKLLFLSFCNDCCLLALVFCPIW
jgi:hypothetical protein